MGKEGIKRKREGREEGWKEQGEREWDEGKKRKGQG